MRLCENAVYVKITTAEDVLDDGTVQTLLEQAGLVAGGTPTRFRDLVRRSPERTAEEGIAALEEGRGAGLHQSARFRFEGDPDGPLRSLEVHAMAHPYTGEHVTQIEFRWSRSVLENPEQRERLAAFVREAIRRTRPLHAHAHDVDDNAMQLVDSPGLLRMGYGREPDELGASDRPGREISRGTWRLVPNWMTYIGPPLIEALDEAGDGPIEPGELPPHDSIAGGWLFTLKADPATPCEPRFRDAQRALRTTLRFDELARRTGRNLGYWARRSRKETS